MTRGLFQAGLAWLRYVPGAAPIQAVSDELAPAQDELARQARRCRHILKTSIVEFYLGACVDRVHGGYLEWLRDGKFIATGDKFLAMQARQLWFFSTLARYGIEKDAALAAACEGFRFLEDKMRDRKHGGYFSKVSDDGRPSDRRKHVYLNVFALYGLTAFHRATGDAGALNAAKALFRIVEEQAHDQENGGYDEFFSEDWNPIVDRHQRSYVGAVGVKTYNTHLHAMEAQTDLYLAWPDPSVRERLSELLIVNTCTLRHAHFACNIADWDPAWRVTAPREQQVSYGHDLECVWLALRAARTLGLSPRLLRNWAEALCDHSLRFGNDRQHGGFFYAGYPGRRADDTRKEWWVQAEALVSMLEMYRLTNSPHYYAAFRRTLDFVEVHQVAREGGWWATRTAAGAPRGTQRSSMWQGAYHSGRALITCAKLLDDLAPAR